MKRERTQIAILAAVHSVKKQQDWQASISPNVFQKSQDEELLRLRMYFPRHYLCIFVFVPLPLNSISLRFIVIGLDIGPSLNSCSAGNYCAC